jgi:hypothetical protein
LPAIDLMVHNNKLLFRETKVVGLFMGIELFRETKVVGSFMGIELFRETKAVGLFMGIELSFF